MPGSAGPSTAPAGAPIAPATRPADPRVEQKTRELFDYLIGEYARVLNKSKDRVSRSVAVVCIAGVPRRDATTTLLDLLKTEKDPLVAMVAWQGLLARASEMAPDEYARWLGLTWPLADRGAFRGDLRVGLLRLLAVAPPDRRARELFAQCFAGVNTQDPDDLPTIVALGETLRAWNDPAVAESVLNQLTVPDAAMKAEAVLHAAGCDVPYAAERWPLGSREMWRLALADYAAWWRRERPRWAGMRPAAGDPEPWRRLRPQYLPAVDFTAAVDPDDPFWRRDLEWAAPDLQAFDVGLVVDATGSMSEVLAWLRRDVRRMMDAFRLLAPQPRVALTFYRDREAGDEFVVRGHPLTHRVDLLARQLEAIEAKGGGDKPEAVLDGLADCLRASQWAASPRARNALVLIGDAPPQPDTQAACERLAAAAAGRGFRLYAVKVKTGYEAEDLSAFDRLADAGRGMPLEADLRLGPGARYAAYEGGSGFRWWLLPGARQPLWGAGEEQEVVSPDARMPGEAIITRVMVDAINPQFEHRVGPPVAILWQMLKEPIPEKHPPFPPRPQDNRVAPGGPFDPQKQGTISGGRRR